MFCCCADRDFPLLDDPNYEMVYLKLESPLAVVFPAWPCVAQFPIWTVVSVHRGDSFNRIHTHQSYWAPLWTRQGESVSQNCTSQRSCWFLGLRNRDHVDPLWSSKQSPQTVPRTRVHWFPLSSDSHRLRSWGCWRLLSCWWSCYLRIVPWPSAFLPSNDWMAPLPRCREAASTVHWWLQPSGSCFLQVLCEWWLVCTLRRCSRDLWRWYLPNCVCWFVSRCFWVGVVVGALVRGVLAVLRVPCVCSSCSFCGDLPHLAWCSFLGWSGVRSSDCHHTFNIYNVKEHTSHQWCTRPNSISN